MPSLRHLAREPLLHFLLIGAAVLVTYSLVIESPAPPRSDEIVVTEDRVRQLANRFAGVWNRPPRPDELDSLINEYVREEILVREALELSMDRDDAVIRQRLAQKMRFLMESAAGAIVPSEAELRDYFEANSGEYARETRIGFEQVFLGEGPSAAEIETALGSLRAGMQPGQVGRRILLPEAMPLAGPRPVDGSFGEGFFEQLEAAERGTWTGPVRSAYGAHLVRVTGREPGGLPEFSEIRDRVETDWRRARAAELAEAQYQRMAERYSVRRPDVGVIAEVAE